MATTARYPHRVALDFGPPLGFLRRRSWVVTLVAIVLSAGCASSPTAPKVLPGAPEPAVAPATSVPPDGDVISQPGTPEGLVADATTGTLAVAVRDPAAVVLRDLTTGAMRATVPLPGGARHLTLAAPGGPVLVPDEERDLLHRLSLPAGTELPTSPVGRQPHDVAALRGGTVLVGDELADTAHLIRPDGTIRVVPAPVQPGGVTAAADGSVALVVGVRGRQVAAYRPDGAEIGRAAAGAGPTHVVAGAVTPAGATFYVADTNGDAVFTYEATLDHVRLVATTKVGARPYGIAYDAGRNLLWIASSAANTVEVRDAATFRVLATHPTARQPNSIAVDERDGSAWIAAATPDGTLQHLPTPKR